MAEREDRPFIFNLDILSGTPQLFISGHKNFSTLFGLISTFLILLIGIIYTIYSVYIFFLKEK